MRPTRGTLSASELNHLAGLEHTSRCLLAYALHWKDDLPPGPARDAQMAADRAQVAALNLGGLVDVARSITGKEPGNEFARRALGVLDRLATLMAS
jgi:hypothetical protein